MSATTTAPGAPVHVRRVSLSRGPAHLVGTLMLAAGLYFLYKSHVFTPLSRFPHGTAPVRNHVFFGVFGCNGWTGMGTAIAGGLLLFGAAEHYLAKLMSLIVGAAAGVAAVVAAINGNVWGLAAANVWTKIGWGACAVILLGNALMPAYRRRVAVAGAGAGAGAATAGTTAAGATTARPAGTTTARPANTAAATDKTRPASTDGAAGTTAAVHPAGTAPPAGTTAGSTTTAGTRQVEATDAPGSTPSSVRQRPITGGGAQSQAGPRQNV